MLSNFRLQAVAAVGALALLFAMSATAQDDPPYKPGNYWSVTGIHVKDGSGLRYANHLATSWSRNQEFAKAQGWIVGYHVLANVYARQGEPDLYLVTVFADMPGVEEGEKRRKAWQEFNKKTMEQMAQESGDRAEYRTVGSEMLLREQLRR
jgi:hypothetical protein